MEPETQNQTNPDSPESGQSSTPAQTPPANPKPAAQPDTTDWKAKYDGLNGLYQQWKGQAEDYKGKYEEAVQQLEAKDLELSSQVKSLDQEVTTLKPQVSELTTRAESAESRVQLMETVIKDFPELVPAMGQGVLNTNGLEGEALTNYLTNMQSAFKDFASSQNANTFDDATPQKPAGSQPAAMTQDQMKSWLMEHFPNEPGYKEMEKAYLATVK